MYDARGKKSGDPVMRQRRHIDLRGASQAATCSVSNIVKHTSTIICALNLDVGPNQQSASSQSSESTDPSWDRSDWSPPCTIPWPKAQCCRSGIIQAGSSRSMELTYYCVSAPIYVFEFPFLYIWSQSINIVRHDTIYAAPYSRYRMQTRLILMGIVACDVDVHVEYYWSVLVLVCTEYII